MQTILETYKETGDIAHAYLIVGNVGQNVNRLKKVVEKISGVSSGGIDHSVFQTNVFYVEDARKIREAGHRASISGGMRSFIIGAHSFTDEAQNALLKILEEPIAGHHFFIVAPNEGILLPTLRSRLLILRDDGGNICDDEGFCVEFMKSQPPERLLAVTKKMEEYDGAEDSKEARIWATGVVLCIQKKLAENWKAENFRSERYAEIMGELQSMENYAGDTASSPKMIMEYLSFVVPRLE